MTYAALIRCRYDPELHWHKLETGIYWDPDPHNCPHEMSWAYE